jgi:hypothetical protein
MSVWRDRVCRLASIASVAVILSACSTMNVGNYCSGSESIQADTKSLAIILGIAPHRLNESPFVVFNSPSLANPDRTLHLNLEPAPVTWPLDLDESPCQGIDWRTYRVAVEAKEWNDFWTTSQTLPFEVGIGALEFVVPMRESEFGFVLIDQESDKTLMHCGCYGTWYMRGT